MVVTWDKRLSNSTTGHISKTYLALNKHFYHCKTNYISLCGLVPELFSTKYAKTLKSDKNIMIFRIKFNFFPKMVAFRAVKLVVNQKRSTGIKLILSA